MVKTQLINQLYKVEQIANYTKIKRLLHNPYKYLYAILFRKLVYPNNNKEKIIHTTVFWGKPMKIALPASTDIYLTGGKSHISEIRLAKFLIQNLNDQDHFLDIGAHYGYFTLLAAELIGTNGKIFSFEPATDTYHILKENTEPHNNITCIQSAVSNTIGTITFYEFPNQQSEYNTIDASQYENEAWFQQAAPKKTVVPTTTIDTITANKNFAPHIIKIDVEGAEKEVMQGATNYFNNHSPKVIMEYLAPDRGNSNHKAAQNILTDMGYQPHIINDEGKAQTVNDIDEYLINNHLESENIVFLKK